MLQDDLLARIDVQTLLDLFGTEEMIELADKLGAHLYRLCTKT